MLKTKLSEFHSGYRAYSVKALRKIPWHLNTNDFHFDTEIIIQFVFAGLRLLEVPIPTYYGEEICHVNGIAYAVNVLRAVTRAKAQELSLFYDRRFDCVGREHGNAQYQLKLNYTSPHKLVIEQVASGSTVLDLGCAGGYVSNLLREKYKCVVTGLDNYPLGANVTLDEFIVHDLNTGLPDLPYEKFKYILLLDVIEHLISPEDFVDSLRNAVKFCPDVTIIASTANVGFFITRIMLLLGQYNYGKRGILDMTHSRLFFFRSFRRLFEQAGFEVVEEKGIPGPYPLALGENRISRFLVSMNNALIRISKRLFSYQIYLTLKPLPSLEYLLTKAFESSKTKSKELGEVKISLP
jgi:2-polyprenyl-3-methyl-5-hydroxy-6-metoxy-1,4-benzoquinol methylase